MDCRLPKDQFGKPKLDVLSLKEVLPSFEDLKVQPAPEYIGVDNDRVNLVRNDLRNVFAQRY